ncbi:hypothetical protein LTR91_007920 [Friedmanniomyces endolithicus]|uniref:Uncharacterized protein n=1 Tax=Friedmanniomyces endolithicus TaxID=329885 RepID=A0AAN6F7W0_9PEZI|nr:hypothetical protein LTR35_003035 [Friedmanniomyces endolithicus]KAK0300406.1 hypothetical protein LTS00_000660 [Friedmanniomyces endolithicus]KAK0306528.1 hypothetical protein LTR82_016365 [Friedmanniomyces endolithicus]KAK0925438.1 hypothetical protein LTR57_005090 [Friedmanniomyces endolithicus]KAK0993566.1 hypothetical protein LTR91_007920 [Friedmanniomyces endolithicus]
MKVTNFALTSAGMLATALAQTSEICELIITKTHYLTATSTLSVAPTHMSGVPTHTSTVEVTSSVFVTVTAAPLPSNVTVITSTMTETVTETKTVYPGTSSSIVGAVGTGAPTAPGYKQVNSTVSADATGTGVPYHITGLPTPSSSTADAVHASNTTSCTETVTVRRSSSTLVGAVGTSASSLSSHTPPNITVSVAATGNGVPHSITGLPTMSSATAGAVSASNTTTRCTTKITVTRPGSNSTLAGPTAPSVTLAPVYSSAMANLTSAIGSGALTSIVPSASVDHVISSYIANLTSALPSHAQPTGAVPTALPTQVINGTAPPHPTKPHNGMSLKQILEWIEYLLSQAFADQGSSSGAGVPRAHSRDLTAN